MSQNQKRWNCSQCPPPRNFHPAGHITQVRLELQTPGFVRSHRVSGARAAGVRHERKVQEKLCIRFPRHYVRSPWFSFFRAGSHQLQYAQPDGLLVDLEQGLIVVVEIKLRHTSDAWWQLRQLYEPIVRHLFGDQQWKYGLVEIVRWFDPATPFPETFQKLANISHIVPGRLGVHVWQN